jgi:hypothetical protein
MMMMMMMMTMKVVTNLIRFRKAEVEYEFYSNLNFIIAADTTCCLGRAHPLFLSQLGRSALESIKSITVQFQSPGALCAGLRNPSGYFTGQIRGEWLRFCQLLAQATHLRNLHVIIFDRGVPFLETILLQPLEPLLHIPNFTLQLPWPREHYPYPDRVLASDEGHPFRVLRPSLPGEMRVFMEPPPSGFGRGIDNTNRRRRPICPIL